MKKEEGRRKKITDCVTDLTEVEKRATNLTDLIIRLLAKIVRTLLGATSHKNLFFLWDGL